MKIETLEDAIAYLKRRAKQRPGEDAMRRLDIDMKGARYGQALLMACIEEIETGETLLKYREVA